MKSHPIDFDVGDSTIVATATECGFTVSFDRNQLIDCWKLSAGHGEAAVEFVGTKRMVSAFLHGYVTMRTKAALSIATLVDIHRLSFEDLRRKL